MKKKLILAFETSCDDTSVALVRDDGYVVECLSANQDLVHRPFGGVVPEIASRNHTLQILPLLEELPKKTSTDMPWDWSNIDGIAVTSRPGLIGSLMVGVVTAKTLALAYNKPLIGVNHIEAHLLAPFLFDSKLAKHQDLKFPFIGLVVSGGHTHLYVAHKIGKYELIGQTLDDAAGEAFDKFAKYLGLGFPGGVMVDQLSLAGNAQAFQFPRTMSKDDSFDYSFSGLKSAAVRMLDRMTPDEKLKSRADLCASYQEAIVDSLMTKLQKAVEHFKLNTVIISGGVSANSRLRDVALKWALNKKIIMVIPPLRYCTDNAAMVGYAGAMHFLNNEFDGLNLAASAAHRPTDFITKTV